MAKAIPKPDYFRSFLEVFGLGVGLALIAICVNLLVDIAFQTQDSVGPKQSPDSVKMSVSSRKREG